MGRRKKADSNNPLSMTTKKADEVFESDETTTTEADSDLETMAVEETEQLSDGESEEKEAPKPKRQRRPRKRKPKVEVAAESEPSTEEKEIEASTDEKNEASSDSEVAVIEPAMPVPVPTAITEAAVSSRVLSQMVNQISETPASGDTAALAKQLTAVKEISISICSQLDRMSATMVELQGKYSAAVQELGKEKVAPKKPRIPAWLVATSGLALLLSVVSVSLTQATRHALLDRPSATPPAHLLTGLVRPAQVSEPSTPFYGPTQKKELAKSSASRRAKR